MDESGFPDDLQSVWHNFVGEELIKNNSILDVGAGRGLSKKRLEKGGNVVTTQDLNRSLVNKVDMVVPLNDIRGSWATITSFDVLEHVPDVVSFFSDLKRLANERIFISTPNQNIYNSPWHYQPEQLILIIENNFSSEVNIRYFGRYKGKYYDFVLEVSKEKFIKDKRIHYFGVMTERLK